MAPRFDAVPLPSDPPWLKAALRDIGMAEIPGKKNNDAIMQCYADCGWRIKDDENGPAEITHETTPWCAAKMGSWLKECGLPIPPKPIALVAQSYEMYGAKVPFDKASGDYSKVKRGDIVIIRRDPNPKSWKRHVTLWLTDTRLAFKGVGGNQGDSVKVSSFAKADIVAIRRPIMPTKQALKKVGSTEMVIADQLRKGAVGVVATGLAAKGGETLATTETAPLLPMPTIGDAAPAVSPDVAPIGTDSLSIAKGFGTQIRDAADQVGFLQVFMEGCRGIGSAIMASPWLIALAVVAAVGFGIAHKVEANRVKRFADGHGLSGQV